MEMDYNLSILETLLKTNNIVYSTSDKSFHSFLPVLQQQFHLRKKVLTNIQQNLLDNAPLTY